MCKDLPTGSCDPLLVSRFHDQELDMEASDRLRAHLDTCSSCRQVLEDHRRIAENFRSAVAGERTRLDADTFEKTLFHQMGVRAAERRFGLLELITGKKFYIPAAALAATLILFFTFFYPAGAPSSPSAIVTSFSGDISSVMIFETPETHQTILWFNEDLPANGKKHAL
jgi:hypothetical protein